jgi:hypothetical protein
MLDGSGGSGGSNECNRVAHSRTKKYPALWRPYFWNQPRICGSMIIWTVFNNLGTPHAFQFTAHISGTHIAGYIYVCTCTSVWCSYGSLVVAKNRTNKWQTCTYASDGTAVHFIANKRYTACIFSDFIISKCPSRMTVHKRGSNGWLWKTKLGTGTIECSCWIFNGHLIVNMYYDYKCFKILFQQFSLLQHSLPSDQPTWLHVYIMEKYRHITNQANCIPNLSWEVWH